MPQGKIFHAAGHPDIQKTRPAYAFVPDALISGNPPVLDQVAYTAQRWASINAGANPHTIGSHIFPDLQKPANPDMPDVVEFKNGIQRLSHKHKGKPSPPKKPGKLGFPESPI